MKNCTFILSFLLILWSSIVNAQPSCSDAFDLATAVGIDAPGFNVNVVNFQYTGGTCATMEYNGQDVTGSSGFDLKVDIGVGADKVICGLVDGTVPNPLDFITIDPTFRCEFNIMNVEGFIEAYAISAYPSASLEKKVSGTVNRTDEIQIYSATATTIELPLQVSASLAAMQTFCPTDPNHSIAEAKASVTAKLGAASVNLTDVASVSGALLDNKITSVSQAISITVPAGVTNLTMEISGEISARSKVRGLSQLGVIVCGSNAGVSAGHVNVGNFTGANGGPLPKDVEIIGMDTGINYTDPKNPIPCIRIPPPNIIVTNDTCGLGLGEAVVSPNSDTLTYEWSNGVSDTITTNLAYGSHSLTVTDTTGCSRDFLFFVDDAEAPDINLPSLFTIEENETLLLNPIDSGGTGLTFLWSTGDTTSTISVNSAGTYSVSITTSSGCEYEAGTLVQVGTPIDFSPCMSANYLFTGNADDLSGNGNNASVFGATLTEDRNGRSESAYYFDGIDDYIELPAVTETQPIQGLTFTAWFKSDNVPNGNMGTIINNSGLGYELTLNKPDDGSISTNLDLQSGNNEQLKSRLNEYADDQWHSLAITYDGNSGIYRLFIDGNLNNETTGSVDSIAYLAGSPITIGGNGVNNNNFFKGVIDDVKIFNCELNIDELSYLFTQQPNFDCNQVVYSEDFEGTIGSEWTKTTTYQMQDPNQDSITLLGRFNDTLRLTLPDMPVNRLVTLCSDLWIIDSWDGNNLTWGPDLFTISVANTRTLLYTNFTNWSDRTQAYPSTLDVSNFAMNSYGTGALIAEDLNGLWAAQGNILGIDAKYRICRTFYNTDDTLHFIFGPNVIQNVTDESWGIDNVEVSYPPPLLKTAAETVTCTTDGSFIVSIPLIPNGDSSSYIAYEQANSFGDIDTIYFTDDGTVTSILLGPYTSGREDYNILIAPLGFRPDCFPVIADSVDCSFTEPCALSTSLQFECENDSLTVTGTIIGGMPPYSVYGNGYTTILFPGDGDTFSYTIHDCSTPVEVVITDINMCMYQDSLLLSVDDVTTFSCLNDVTLSPNPTNSTLRVSTVGKCGAPRVSIYNTIGRLVYSGLLSERDTVLDLGGLEAGVYLLYVEDGEGSLIERFVKL